MRVQKHPPLPVRVLIAPLDWGLGHATRCIPLIRYFQQKGCSIWIAAEGKVRSLLLAEFPGLPFLELIGYRIQYSDTGTGLWFKVSIQVPSILQTIRYERRWLKKTQEEYHFDVVVSDNRFGLTLPGIHSIYITHQLRIRIPGFPFAEALLQRLHYHYIRRFSACWVPDAPGIPNLSGVLGHPPQRPSVPVRYLGLLTRFQPSDPQNRFHLLVLLSGPEPQRTLLEARILPDLGDIPGKVCLVRGLPGVAEVPVVAGNVQVYNHLPSQELNKVICDSTWVVARSGYSTLMDLVRLGKKAILVPTPGQTEQAYLARYAESQGLGVAAEQAGFRLGEALARAETAVAVRRAPPGEAGRQAAALAFQDNFQPVVDELLAALALERDQ